MPNTPDTPGFDAHDASKPPRAVENITESETKVTKESMEVEQMVRDLIAGQLDKAESYAHRSQKLQRMGEEPQHPMLAACESWRNAILSGNPLKAEMEAARVKTLMPMYAQRPRFMIPFKQLHFDNLLDQANLKALEALCAASKD